MVYFFFAAAIAAALFQCLLLKGSLLFAAAEILISLAGIAFRLLGRKLPAVLSRLGWGLCLAAVVILMLVSGNLSAQEQEYDRQIDAVEQALSKGDLEEAGVLLSGIEAFYGQDDNTVYLSVIERLSQKDLEGAYAKLEEMKDKTSRLYYVMKEQLYLIDPSEGAQDLLCQTYLEAANAWPDWAYMQKAAGKAQIHNKNYESAAYYLEKALAEDSEDAETYFYLGTADYYLNDHETAKACFEQALAKGLAQER